MSEICYYWKMNSILFQTCSSDLKLVSMFTLIRSPQLRQSRRVSQKSCGGAKRSLSNLKVWDVFVYFHDGMHYPKDTFIISQIDRNFVNPNISKNFLLPSIRAFRSNYRIWWKFIMLESITRFIYVIDSIAS